MKVLCIFGCLFAALTACAPSSPPAGGPDRDAIVARNHGPDPETVRERWEHRDLEDNIEAILSWMDLKAGMRIGEGGAGTGYLTFHLARKVGPSGLVYANDIDRESLETLRYLAQAFNSGKNIVPVLGLPDDPLFPAGNLDLIAVCNTLHHIQDRSAWLTNAWKYLKPGGALAVIDFTRSGHSDFSPEVLRTAAQAAGFEFNVHKPLKENHFFCLYHKP